MATQIQFRRGTDVQHDSFTGATGEVTVNTTNKSLHVHDGTTAGGFEAARTDLSNHSNVGILTATIFSGDVNSSGVSTFANGDVVVGGATTTLVVTGDTRITGILTVGTASITLDGTSTQINVGSGTTIHTGGYRIGSSDLHSTGLSISNLTVTNNATVGGGLTVTGELNVPNGVTVTGVTTSSAGFSGDLTGNVTGNLTGDVTGTVSSISNHDTGDLTEGTNLYYTDTRARSAISVTDSGGDGSLSYNSGTGAITYTGPSASEVRSHFSGGTGVSISSGEISIGQEVATTSNVTFNDVIVSNNTTVGGGLTVTGNLVVNGTTTTINSTTISVDDKNIELGSTASPSDSSADGGGITLKGTTDHTISWSNTNDSWDFSEHVNIVTGKEYRIADTSVLSATTLGSGVVNSSLTSVGTITSGTWQGTAIANAYLANSTISGVSLGSNLNTLTLGVSGTGLSGSQTYDGSGAVTFTVTSNATNANTASTIVARDASGNFSAGTITASLTGNVTGNTSGSSGSCTGNAATASALATARSIGLSGDVSGSASFDGSAGITITATVADDSHNHVISNVDGLQTALDGKLSTTGKAADSNLLDGIDSGSFLRSDASDSASGELTFNGRVNIRGHIDLSDNEYLYFGSSDDVELFCNGSHMYMDLNSGIGNFYIRDGSTTRFTFDDAGHFTATGDITSSSDIRLKTNIKTLTNSLDKVLQMRGVEYDRIDLEDKHQIGLIAQEVEKVVPEFVSVGDDDMKSVSYGNITALLIEAVKEQQEQIEQLKQEILELKDKS